jgi:DNA-binding MurR/RpiR family transcriptional regulator
MMWVGGNGTEKRRRLPDLEALIKRKYPELPENQKKVADFFLANVREVPFLSVTEIEHRAGTSKATVVRLAQSLGFTGFLELRRKLRTGLQLEMGMSDVYPFPTGITLTETLDAVAQQDLKNIQQTVQQLDRKVFHAVADAVVHAGHVYTLGLGISSLMAQVLAYSLNQVAVSATAFVHEYETFLDQVPFLKQDDLLIAFSFPPYSRETVDAVKAAANRKVRVVGITDRVTSPVSYRASFVLPIRSTNMIFTNSISAISVVINALVTEVALKNRSRALRLQKEIGRLHREAGHFTAD